ncbi:DUF1642 domain-containing protein [Enterococcus faecium]|nr:DUF1642 domain-containing protein [Enterococcus faecium]
MVNYLIDTDQEPTEDFFESRNWGEYDIEVYEYHQPQLDEQQKPVMPKFFDDWAKRVIAERNKFYAISLIARAGWGYVVDYELGKSENPSTTRELLDWLVEDSLYLNKEKAINALLYGYEVEKEPLYTVTLSLDLKYYLVIDENECDGISPTLTTSSDVLGYRYYLTEKEIKSADNNLWAFAVPVEEVAER